MSRNLPLHPQHKITNTQILDSIREQFKIPYFFEPGDYENTLVNASQREMEGVTASRVYLLNKHVQKILYSSKDSYQKFHIVQAGCGGFERRSGKASGQYCYRIETPMTFLLGRNDDYCIHISLPFFEKILQCGLKQQDEENPVGESVPFRDCQEFKEDLEGL